MSEPKTPTTPPRPHRSAAPGPAPSEPKRTPAFPIAIVLGLIGFVWVIMQLPFEGDPGTMNRLGKACVALLVGMLIYGGARGLVESVLKAAVEVLAVLLFLLNALGVALVILWRPQLTAWAIDAGFGEEHAFWQAALLLGGTAFLLDALVFLLLYPLSRIVGTRLNID